MTKYYAIGAVAAVVALIMGLVYVTMGGRGSSDDKFAQCRSSQVAGGAGAIGGPFTLIDETGKTVTSEELIDKPTLLYFGYSFCPDVCPLDNARNAEAITILEERGKIVKPVFISIDPERDTPELLADFTDYMHPRMIGMTGTMEQVKAASKAYRTYFKKQEPEPGDEDYYLIDHSTFSYLVFPEEGFVEFFKRNLTPVQVADQIGCFLDAQ